MPTPTDLLFAADRALRDAASRYGKAETLAPTLDEIRARESDLRRAARDYSTVADAIDGLAAKATDWPSVAEAIARITATPAKDPAP